MFVVRLEVSVCVGGAHIYVTMMMTKWRTTTLHKLSNAGVKIGVKTGRAEQWLSLSHAGEKGRLISARLTPKKKSKTGEGGGGGERHLIRYI